MMLFTVSKINRIILQIVFFFFFAVTPAQIPYNVPASRIDSAKALLSEASGNEKADLFNVISSYYASENFDSCIAYAEKAMEISSELNYSDGIGLSKFNSGNAYFFKDDMVKAYGFYLEALNILDSTKLYKDLGNLFVQFGFIHDYLLDYARSVEFYKKAVGYYKLSHDNAAEMFTCRMIFTAYYTDPLYTNLDSAYKYVYLQYDYYKDYPDEPSYLFSSMNELGLTMRDMGYTESYSYLLNSLEYILQYENKIVQGISSHVLIGLGYINLSEYYMDPAVVPVNPDLAVELAEKAIKHLNKTDYHKVRSEVFATLGDTYYKMGKINEAKEEYLHSLLEIDSFYLKLDKPDWLYINQKIRFLNYLKFLRIDVIKELINISLLKPDHKEAYFYQQKMLEAEKALYQEDLRREMAELSIRHLGEINKEQVSRLKLENEVLAIKKRQNQYLVYIFGSLSAFILIMIYFIIRQVRLKEMQKSVILEQKLLRSRMNPHFIFNSLASIQGFMMEKDTRSASRYLSRFASLVRDILDDSTQEYISLEKEISIIENYLELQKARYGDKFDYIIEVDEVIDPGSITVPPMLAQPFIENSIEHGFKNKGSKGNLRVSFKLNGSMLILEIEDDGIGRQKAQEILKDQGTKHKSLATEITRERIQSLNRRAKNKITMEIIDLKDEQGEARGTRVVFGIPVSSGGREEQ